MQQITREQIERRMDELARANMSKLTTRKSLQSFEPRAWEDREAEKAVNGWALVAAWFSGKSRRPTKIESESLWHLGFDSETKRSWQK